MRYYRFRSRYKYSRIIEVNISAMVGWQVWNLQNRLISQWLSQELILQLKTALGNLIGFKAFCGFDEVHFIEQMSPEQYLLVFGHKAGYQSAVKMLTTTPSLLGSNALCGQKPSWMTYL